MAAGRTLSKSDFLAARECSAKLYFKENKFPDNRASNAYLSLLATGGYMVEALACAQRPTGIPMQHGRDFDADFRTTMEALKQDDVILFQPTFVYNRRLVRVDILEKRGKVVKLIEVKAKSFNSVEHAESLATGGRGCFRGKKKPFEIKEGWQSKFEEVTFQTLILRHLLPDCEIRPFLLLVDKSKEAGIEDIPTLFAIERDDQNPDYVRGVRCTATPEQLAQLDLLTEVDMADEVAALADEIEASAQHFETMLDDDFATPLDRGVKCAGCEYRFSDVNAANGFDLCWGELAKVKPSALELFRITTILDENKSYLLDSMVNSGKVGLSDIPIDLLRKKDGTFGIWGARQRRQIENTKSGDVWIGDQLKEKLESLTYPLHYIDFEGSRIALPYHAKMRPYGQVAFQWSVHTLDAPGAELRHSEWLNVDYLWPNVAFAKSLRDVIGDTGSVLVWSAYEGSTLKGIVEEHDRFQGRDEELCTWVVELEEKRFFDLHKCAQSDFYHPGMRGRTSIKVVMDALWKADPALRDQFRSFTGMDVPDSADDPYKSLPKLVIAGVEQDVHEGTGAMRAYEAMMYGAERNDPVAKATWCTLLLQYCKLDTLSMVLIHEYWRRAV